MWLNVIESEWNEFINDNKCMEMNTVLKINQAMKMNTGMKLNTTIKMNAWMGMNVGYSEWKWMQSWWKWRHELKCITESTIQNGYQKDVNDKYLESSDIQHSGHLAS